MPVIPFKERQQIGLDFIEFLGERRSLTNKSELKDIYNTEFRNRNGVKAPNFSSVLFALKRSSKAKIWSGEVFFHPKVRVFYQDQWRSQRQQGSSNVNPVQNGASGIANGLPGVSMASSPGPGKGPEVVSGVRARRELANIILQKLNAKETRAAFISEKEGIRITSDHAMADGCICFSIESMAEVYVVRLFIENSGSSLVHFTYYSALHRMSCFNLKDEKKVTRANPCKLRPGESYEIQVQFQSSLIGFYPATLAFEFKPDLLPSTPAFHIVRFIEAQYETALAKELAPTAPYKPRSIMALQMASQPYTIEDGIPPESLSVRRLKSVVPLKDYKVPAYVRELIRFLNDQPSSSSLSSRQNLHSAKAVLEAPLSRNNYSEKFQLLLYLEELQMEVDIKRYNMENEPMVRDTRDKKLLVLQVPGVSENRPSVLRGDALLMTRPGEGARGEAVVKYRGYVHRVELDQVKLSFNNKLLKNFIDGMKFNVEFTVSRLTTRLQQRAAELVSEGSLGDVLFPSASTQQPQLPTLKLFNRNLEKNPEQYKAVQHIVAGSSRPAPYLVFGPPGTGKTVTVVEAIKQLAKTQSSAYILACAPSNSAADLLCKEIVEHVDVRKVFRMYASSRNPWDVPVELLDCCNLDGENFVFPSKEELMEYTIMVTTLLTAGRLVTGGVPLGHYTHVFVDEAGHALETECIISLAGLLKVGKGQVVLAGDPKQLGPILRSPVAIKHGMGLSLLERLMSPQVPLYQKDEEGTYNNRFVTKLLRNYRSHPAILKIPNELFYDGELQVYADEIVRNSYCNWEYLPKKGFPVVFHGVTGRDLREGNSPSFFNAMEVEVLMDYLRKLLQNQGKKGMGTIALKDIGIIAPYRKQVEKIRIAIRKLEKELKLMNIKDLKVGSVEEFQGQERKVILVSTVRSSAKYVRIDQQFTLGFIKNDKRFNVAITRAKALLIVVGNPLVLRGDSTWGRFIQYCSEGGRCPGFDCSEAEGPEEVMERLAALCLQAEPQVETDESQLQQQHDPEWKNEL